MPAFATRTPARAAFAAVLLLAAVPDLPAQLTPDQQAAQVLDAARRAYNDKNYPFAVTRFREFLQRFGGHKDAPAARYGLALALLDGPDRDYQAVLNELAPLSGNAAFPEHAHVLYYQGLARRGLGVKALAQAAARPNEAPQLRQQAQGHFDEAAKQFAAALAAFTARAKPPADDAKGPTADAEWAARARCDLAEMQVRTGKAKEARATAAPFADDKALARSRYHGLGLYYHGYACFLLKEDLAAGRSLGLLAPFADPVFGTHARYLLARVHHREGERPEALAHYEGVLADHAKQKAAAAEALKQPDRFKNDPEEKGRLEALANGPPPDHVSRATFFLGVMQYEDGKFADALTAFKNFRQQLPQSPLAAEAQLREGYCQVQLKQWVEAQNVLRPLADKEPRLADQALLWVAKAQVGAADPNNAPAYEQALRAALDTFRRAAEKAQQAAASDPDARVRRGEVLFETAETQQLLRQPRDAVAAYTTILNEKLLPQREEEVAAAAAAALHLAGDYAASDQACDRFVQTYPKSTLLAAVLFRRAENAAFQMQAAEKIPDPAQRAREVARLGDEAAKRYQAVADKYPESPHAGLARYGVAMAHYRKGEYDKAREKLEAIPAPDRTGELALVPYLLADVLIRTAPARADDAVAAGKLEEQLKGAAEQLDAFVAANTAGPQAADGLLKLGYCHQRLAGLLAQKEEKDKALAAARAAYEQVMQRFPKSASEPQAVFERAKCIALAGDVNGAANELRRFAGDPLKAAPVAPLALLHLATLLRGQNKPQEAADVLGQCRQQHEAALRADPARAGWVALLQYHHAVALREAGKRDAARAAFDQVAAQAPDRPEAADAALRSGQCLKDDAEAKLAEAAKKLAVPNLKPEETAAARKLQDEGAQGLRNAAAFFQTRADQLKGKPPAAEARARMLYEAAWAHRGVAALEVEAARTKLRQELWQKLRDEAAKKAPPGGAPAAVPAPEVPRSAVPLQPAETQARAAYKALIAEFPDAATNADARFELAELLGERGEHDAAVAILKEALDKEPGPELTDKVRLRLGTALLAKGDAKGALAQLEPVAANPKSPLVGQAAYRAAECFLHTGDAAEAAKRLAVFRDKGEFQNLPGVTDRALLRLGHTLAQLKQWEPSRQAYEQVVSRFGGGPWVHEARYGMAWALQNLGRYDEAVNAYTQVTGAVETELAARAQLNVGLCRMAQKRYPEAATALLVVPYTYDYPAVNALALVEAARAFSESKQEEQAVRLLERVLRDHPGTEQAEAAKKRLAELKRG